MVIANYNARVMQSVDKLYDRVENSIRSNRKVNDREWFVAQTVHSTVLLKLVETRGPINFRSKQKFSAGRFQPIKSIITGTALKGKLIVDRGWDVRERGKRGNY